MDETSGSRADSHGSNTLTDNNTVGNATGIINLAALFVSANNEYLSHASNASLETGNIDFAFSLWFYVNTTQNQILLSKDDDGPGGRDYTIALSSAGALKAYFNGGGGVGVNEVVTSNGAISTATWYYVVVWHDATADTWNMRLDDTTTYTANTGGTSPDVSAAEFEIGRREYSGAEEPFDGRIDEVGFWKRVLTGAEITQLYNSGSGLAYPF